MQSAALRLPLTPFLGISKRQELRNKDIRQQTETTETVIHEVCKRRLAWFAHVNSMGNNGWEVWAYKALYICKLERNRSRVKPRKRWMDNIKKDLELKILTIVEGYRLTQDQVKWNGVVSNFCRHAGKK